jgi:hypothetical protein
LILPTRKFSEELLIIPIFQEALVSSHFNPLHALYLSFNHHSLFTARLNAALNYAAHKLHTTTSFTKTESNEIDFDGPVATRIRMDNPLMIRLAQENLSSTSGFYGSKVDVILPKAAYVKPLSELSSDDQFQVFWRCEELLNVIAHDLDLVRPNRRILFRFSEYTTLLHSFSRFPFITLFVIFTWSTLIPRVF